MFTLGNEAYVTMTMTLILTLTLTLVLYGLGERRRCTWERWMRAKPVRAMELSRMDGQDGIGRSI
jgi:hypothetical protein